MESYGLIWLTCDVSVMLNPTSERDVWLEILVRELPDERIYLWPDVADPDSVEFAVFWHHDPADLLRYPKLRTILSVSAGVEQFLGGVYPEVPIVRLSDPAMAAEMAAYAVHWVVHFHRRMATYLELQSVSEWRPIRTVDAHGFPVGILGYGVMGRTVGEALTRLGYPLGAWTRSGGQDADVTHFRGSDGLDQMLSTSAAVINILPLTPYTEGLINADRFAQFRRGALYMSMGRGGTTVEADLLAALDRGPLGTAVLDVTAAEPLPTGSPLWNHPRVRITPHASGFTRARTAAPLVAANIRRVRRGEQPFPLYDPLRGY
ncbi:MAG: glyoxylate/hydroxypyruvate reductase A [bacterium]|nr:glyoxylate/hydroxypyruvate reductase A [bacterium]MDE0288792.1 glyoxylate/hydroxypyruvate reductase A [bacterium]MDE0438463.1 glyoxylate/hydroxypyruvate reductase A [bacterium]